MTLTRRVIVTILVIFVVYAILTAPQDSAGVVRDAGDRIQDGLNAIGSFFDTLIS